MALSVSAEFSLMELHGGLLPKRPLGPLLIRGLFSSTLQVKQREQLYPPLGITVWPSLIPLCPDPSSAANVIFYQISSLLSSLMQLRTFSE